MHLGPINACYGVKISALSRRRHTSYHSHLVLVALPRYSCAADHNPWSHSAPQSNLVLHNPPQRLPARLIGRLTTAVMWEQPFGFGSCNSDGATLPQQEVPVGAPSPRAMAMSVFKWPHSRATIEDHGTRSFLWQQWRSGWYGQLVVLVGSKLLMALKVVAAK